MAERRVLRVMIVDDEPLARQRLKDLLREEPDVEIVGEAGDGSAAVEGIRRLHPDLVFLDVQMPGKTGLDVAREVGADAMPPTIFVTAYDQYALQAFDLAAVDYLVKPFDDERFEQAFRRARRSIELEEFGRMRAQLLAVLGGGGASGDGTVGGGASVENDAAARERGASSRAPYLERIAVEMKGKVRVVPVVQIDYITASGPYAELHVGDRRFVIREPMQELEERLDPREFMRIHRSAIVRLELIETLLKGEGGDY
ncbi:MAG TPA: response regulator transcription factor, partial [Gemmatimonadaceae bacterium]|nr:response regulator transcription factor [Gemmatimonadaceae bacterium]